MNPLKGDQLINYHLKDRVTHLIASEAKLSQYYGTVKVFFFEVIRPGKIVRETISRTASHVLTLLFCQHASNMLEEPS